MSQDTERFEIKFRIDKTKESQFLYWLYHNTNFSSEFPERVNNSLYFDNATYKFMFDNISGISRRKKIRLRWYSEEISPCLSDSLHSCRKYSNKLFLEDKRKDGLLCHKKELASVKIPGKKKSYEDMIFFLRKFCNQKNSTTNFQNNLFLHPSIFIQYKRKYFSDPKGVRLTIDDEVFYSPVSENANISGATRNHITIEIKFHPKEFQYVADLLSRSDMRWIRSSKYLFGLSKVLGFQY